MVISQYSIQMKTDIRNEYCAGRLALIEIEAEVNSEVTY